MVSKTAADEDLLMHRNLPEIKFLTLLNSLLSFLLALFPGSPHMRTKNQKEKGEPGKIYHMRNVTGRGNLITSGRTNELAHTLWTEYTRSIVKALWLIERD